ncbi:MAG: tetratricopeptide repeat protein [Bacteroidetes bacterium]|nr:tetratricopeptide repeat protein [Bacteroidota bacterium]
MQRQEYIRSVSIICLSLSLLGVLNARQNQSEQVYQAFISDRMEDWDRVIVSLNGRKTSLSDEQLGELVNYYYGYTAWALGEGLKKKAGRYIEEAEEIIDELMAKYPNDPDWYAYKGAFVAYKIRLSPIRAPFLGSESIKNIDRAIEIGPHKPQAWIEKGNALFYMPKAFGGSKEKAIEAYSKAIRIMEKDPGSIHHNWIYLNVLMALGHSYEKTGNLQLAKSTYEKLLEIEPNFTYVRDEIYPTFMKSLNP